GGRPDVHGDGDTRGVPAHGDPVHRPLHGAVRRPGLGGASPAGTGNRRQPGTICRPCWTGIRGPSAPGPSLAPGHRGDAWSVALGCLGRSRAQPHPFVSLYSGDIMAIKVQIPTPMRQHTEGKTVVEVTGTTVKAALDDLGTRFPGITQRIFVNGQVRQFV